MKKRFVLATAMILFSTVAWAQENELHGTIDLTYVSRYIWRGADVYASNHSAIRPSIDLDLFGTGFGVNVWMVRANKSGFENSEWLTYTFYYKNAAFAGERYQTNYNVGYTYFSYPDEPRKGTTPATGAVQEVFGAFAWPNLLGSGLVPSYVIAPAWPSNSGGVNRHTAGCAHIFGLNYDWMVPSLLDSGSEQAIHLGFQTVYNDGVGPPGKNMDHDFLYGLFSISTDFPLADNLTFSPGFHYQSSWDDSNNTSDEYWTSLSLTYKF